MEESEFQMHHIAHYPFILCAAFISAKNHFYYCICTPWTKSLYSLHFILASPSFCLKPTHSTNAKCQPPTSTCHLPHLPPPQSSPRVEARHHFSCPITATVVPLLKDSAGTPVKRGLSYKKRWITASPFSILCRNEMSELAAVFFSAPSATGHCRN